MNNTQIYYLAAIILIVALLFAESLTRDRPKLRRLVFGVAAVAFAVEVFRRFTKTNDKPVERAGEDDKHEPSVKPFDNPAAPIVREVDEEHDRIDVLPNDDLVDALREHGERANEEFKDD